MTEPSGIQLVPWRNAFVEEVSMHLVVSNNWDMEHHLVSMCKYKGDEALRPPCFQDVSRETPIFDRSGPIFFRTSRAKLLSPSPPLPPPPPPPSRERAAHHLTPKIKGSDL